MIHEIITIPLKFEENKRCKKNHEFGRIISSNPRGRIYEMRKDYRSKIKGALSTILVCSSQQITSEQ